MTDLEDTSQGEFDVDAALESIHAPSDGIPMSQEPQTPPEPQAPQEYEYDWRGQKVKEPLEMILKRAGMGRDYNHLVEEHKRKVSEWENQRKEYDQKYSRYREIDDYIQKDPNWWDHVQSSYQKKDTSQVDPNLKPFLEKIEALEGKLSTWEQEKQQHLFKQEDEKLTQEIQGIRKQYADLPWDTPDESGRTLEYRVIEHANQNKIPTFKAAFLDLNHDLLEKRWEARGREAVVKDTQKRSKLGLLGETSAPKKGLTQAVNVKNRSYDDLLKEAFEEEGIA